MEILDLSEDVRLGFAADRRGALYEREKGHAETPEVDFFVVAFLENFRCKVVQCAASFGQVALLLLQLLIVIVVIIRNGLLVG